MDENGNLVIGGDTFAFKASRGCNVVSINGLTYAHTVEEGSCPTKADRLTEAEQRLVGARVTGSDAASLTLLVMDAHRFFHYERKTENVSRLYVGTYRLDDAGVLHVVVPTGEEVFAGRVARTVEGAYLVCVDESCIEI
jgi:hypothetical protein